MRDSIRYYLGEIPYLLRRLWLVAKHRPLLKCPFCNGIGGHMSGGEEPDLCGYCWHDRDNPEVGD
jgi:hypothetical protein